MLLLGAVLGVAAVYCKSGSYLPMVLLTLLIPAAAYGSPTDETVRYLYLSVRNGAAYIC